MKDENEPCVGNAFTDPLKDWPNADILIAEEAQNELREKCPDLYPVLDWPELRNAFVQQENIAAINKKANQRQGLLAIVLSTLGLLIIAALPLFQSTSWLAVASAILSSLLIVVGGLLGIEISTRGAKKTAWINARVRAERLRHFYFQCLINEIPLVVSAIRDTSKIKKWHAKRKQLFDDYSFAGSKGAQETIEAIRIDDSKKLLWLDSDWQQDSQIPRPSAAMSRLFWYLDQRRIGIQLEYANKQNLPGNFRTKSNIANTARYVSYGLTFLLLSSAVIIGVATWATGGLSGTMVLWGLVIQAILAELIAASKVIDDALGWRTDSRRYVSYAINLEMQRDRFQAGTAREKVDSLEEVESLAYEELRGFIEVHYAAKFIV